MSNKSERRSLSRREFLRGAAVVAGAGLLAGCASQQASEAPAEEAAEAAAGQAASSATKIVIWGWPAADKAYESFLADFKAAHPDIETDIQMTQTADEHNKLLAALAAGTGAPDVGMIEINYIDKFVVKGGLEDLLASPYNAGKYQQDMVEYKWKQGTTPDGRLVAFPWDIGPATFFYRRDLFEEAGLPSDPEEVNQLTKTWSGFIEMGKQLTNPEQQRWAIGSAGDIVYTEYAHRNFFDQDWNVIVDQGRPVELLQIALEARQAGIDAKVANWTPEWQALLGQGALAIQYGGCWMGGFLKGWLKPEDVDWTGKWGVFEVPENPGQNWGGSFLAIPEQSQNKEAAWAFIEYALANKEAQNKMFQAVDYFPAYKPAFDDPLYEEPDPFFGNQKTREMWVDIAVNKIEDFVTTPMDAQAEQIFTSYVTQCLDQGLDPQETLTKAAQEIETQTAVDKEEALKLRG